MWKDPIVEEIRKHSEEYFASFNHDLDAIYKDIKKREEKLKNEGWKFVTPAEMQARNQE